VLKGRSREWSPAEKGLILRMAGTSTDAEIAAALSVLRKSEVTEGAVKKQRQRMGVSKR
jgi:hypothetical protein